MSQMASVLLNMILVLICVNLSVGCIVLPISLSDNSVAGFLIFPIWKIHVLQTSADL